MKYYQLQTMHCCFIGGSSVKITIVFDASQKWETPA